MPNKILIIDDEEDFIESLDSILTDKGYDVGTACSGKEALEKAVSFHPDLIILDLVMPGMSGNEVCEKIRKNPALERTPVLIMTGFDNGERKSTSFISGADDYITKPFNPETFLCRVDELLSDQGS